MHPYSSVISCILTAAVSPLLLGAVLHAAPPVRIMQLDDSLTAQSDARKFLHEKLTADGYSFECVG
ncbi:MAG: hypothetical protein WC661_04635 [Opitutaceae bacterium]|jgi:hypothetical protein